MAHVLLSPQSHCNDLSQKGFLPPSPCISRAPLSHGVCYCAISICSSLYWIVNTRAQINSAFTAVSTIAVSLG